MKKSISLFLVLLFAFLILPSCGKKNERITVAVPGDTTNQARALLLLQDQGIIKLKDGSGITASVKDIAENPYNIIIKKYEASQITSIIKDVDFAIINSNFALSSGLSPINDSLAVENSHSSYGNIVAVKEGNEKTDKTRALVAALKSKQVADFIMSKYGGSVISAVDNPGNGFDDKIDYAALAGITIRVAASPSPHAEILKIAKDILAQKNITLEIKEYSDYDSPNKAVENEEADANYFQHTPYLNDYNIEKGTHIVGVATIHIEPLAIYGGKTKSLEAIKLK